MGLEVPGLFLNISNAFDKDCHAGLGYKLPQNGIYGALTNIVNCFFIYRKQRVVLNAQCLSWVDIWTGVSQDSILGPPLFFTNVSDLRIGLKSECKLFVDTLLYFP